MNRDNDKLMVAHVAKALKPYALAIQPEGIVGADKLADYNARALAKAALKAVNSYKDSNV